MMPEAYREMLAVCGVKPKFLRNERYMDFKNSRSVREIGDSMEL